MRGCKIASVAFVSQTHKINKIAFDAKYKRINIAKNLKDKAIRVMAETNHNCTKRNKIHIIKPI